MKKCVVLISITAALSAPAAETSSTAARAPVVLAAYRGMPWLDNSKLPWLSHAAPSQPITKTAPATDPALAARKLEMMLVTLNADLANTESGLTTLTSRIDSVMA